MHDGEGWFRTGDMGFLLNGELFVVGRKKDLLIVRGRNIYPEDIEDCVSAVPGVYSGRVVAYGEYVESLGTEMPALLVEVQDEVSDQKELELKIRSAVQSVLELQLLSIAFVPHRWLVKSSSGKMARKTNVERWKKVQAEQHAPCEAVASTGN
jgi:acyl-CoA synthetase (AMP-forming)/AMP-acid ligase II